MSWFVAIILLCFDLVRALAMITLAGCLMITGAIVYHAMQPTTPLLIRFEDGSLTPAYGWSFWLAFSAGHHSYIAIVQIGRFIAFNLIVIQYYTCGLFLVRDKIRIS